VIEFCEDALPHRHGFLPWPSVALTALLLLASSAAGCRHAEAPAVPIVAQVAGTQAIDGLDAQVRVVRDRWGIPHIYAASQRDLFFAQGFVQAQDRLFQMDLWRRAVQGRLSEVLGPNFIERDAMTRRIQYAGDPDADWALYGDDAKAIAAAFVRGVNAWVSMARAHPPEEFALAGWLPELWHANDLLNRTDAVVENAGVLEDIARAGFGEVVGDSIRRAGAAPFFTGLAAPVRRPRQEQAASAPADRELASGFATSPRGKAYATVAGTTVEFAESSNGFASPSPRYIVHLAGAGWNVIGITSPWRPGVAAGHNDRVAWAFTPSGARTHIVRAIPDTAPVTETVTRTIIVKGRAEPFSYPTESTREGIVIATDREAHRRFVFDWTGFTAGAAPEMIALAIDRVKNRDEFLQASRRWILPARSFVVVEADAQPARGSTASDQRAVVAEPGRPARALFAHPLAVTESARRRFNIGPVSRPIADQPVRLELHPESWDRSRAISVPGQSEEPDSPHCADQVGTWSSGGLIPLAFTDAAVAADSEATLTLVPARPK
jgi:acyl-homoserine lactone acylase PvdQ